MATTKKPTEATETAEQVQADNSRAEVVKAENEAAEKPTAPVYTAEEYARAAAKILLDDLMTGACHAPVNSRQREGL